MKKLVVLGAAESGVGAAILARRQGCDVFVSDMGQIQPRYKSLLDDHAIAREEGGHTESKILDADEVVKSPGIPPTAPMIVKLRERNIPIISEIEYAARFTDARMICITGSNGKTTTTSLIYHICRKAGMDVGQRAETLHRFFKRQPREPAKHVVKVKFAPDKIEIHAFFETSQHVFGGDFAVKQRFQHEIEAFLSATFHDALVSAPTRDIVHILFDTRNAVDSAIDFFARVFFDDAKEIFECGFRLLFGISLENRSPINMFGRIRVENG